MSGFKKGIVSVFALVMVVFSMSASAGNIGVDIDIDNYWLDANENVIVHVTFTNHGKKPAKILKWYTAADGIEDNLFKISRDGQTLRYLGAHYKRPAPHAGNYMKFEDLLCERGIDVSYETVRRWALKFGQAYAYRLRRVRS